MTLYTSMAPRTQATPYGTITVRSRRKWDRYYLAVYGSVAAVRWLFPDAGKVEIVGRQARHFFNPAEQPITVERELRRACNAWQGVWTERLQDHEDRAGEGVAEPAGGPALDAIGQLFDHLFLLRKSRIASTTHERDRYYLKCWRECLGESTPLLSLNEHQVAQARALIAQKTSASTANCATATLKTYLKWALQESLLSADPLKGLRKLDEPDGHRCRRDWWTSDQVELAIECAELDPHQPTATLLVAVGCLLGLRPEEIIMLRWEDLDLDAKHPSTDSPKPVCHLTPHEGWKPKSGHGRDIPVPERLHRLLLRYRQPRGYLLVAERERRRGKAIATWSYRYDPRKVWQRISERIRAVGGKAITVAGMRHTFASNLLIAGATELKVSRWLGHSDTRMVSLHYGHLLSYDGDINLVRYGS